MQASIRVFEDDGTWKVDDPEGEPQSFRTRDEAMAAAALLGERFGRAVETPVSDSAGTP